MIRERTTRGKHHDGSSARRDTGTTLTVGELIELRRLASLGPAQPRSPVRQARSGTYLSAIKGRGIDFDEVRAYQPGDDVRAIDWRVTARTGRPHTKVYREERERAVLLLVDTGPSMRFGTHIAFKSVVAGRAAAALAWAAEAHGDRVGGVVFSGNHHREIRPAGRRRGVLRFISALCKVHEQSRDETAGSEAQQTERLTDALTRLARIAHPGSLIYLLSDFRGLGGAAETAVARLAKHCDVVACLIYDPLEAAPPPPGRYAISDGEHTAMVDFGDTTTRDAYSEIFRHRYDGLKELCRRNRTHFLALGTQQPVLDALRTGLRRPDTGRIRPSSTRRTLPSSATG